MVSEHGFVLLGRCLVSVLLDECVVICVCACVSVAYRSLWWQSMCLLCMHGMGHDWGGVNMFVEYIFCECILVVNWLSVSVFICFYAYIGWMMVDADVVSIVMH